MASNYGWLQLMPPTSDACDPGGVREYKRLEVLSFAFMESLCIYGLVIALAILFANPFR